MSPAGVVTSTAMHAVLAALAIVGLPDLWRTEAEPPDTITVELVTLAEEVRAPAPEPEPEPAPAPEPEETAEPEPDPAPEPEVARPDAPEPPPLPEIEPLPELASVGDVEVPEPVALPEPEPLPAPPPEPKIAEPEPAPVPPPVEKPEVPTAPVEDVALAAVAESLLLDRVEDEPAPETTSFEDVAAALDPASDAPPSDEETATLASVIARQIEEKWTVLGGAAEAESLVVKIEIALSTDARVLGAEVVDVEGDGSEEFKIAARDAALRAVNHFRERPFLNLPADRYDVWRRLIIRFDPGQMLRTRPS